MSLSLDEINKETIEHEEMAAFIKSHPYPSYDEMIKRIGNNMQMYAEYGVVNHECLQNIWNSHFDKNVCKRSGRIIYQLGGLQAMQQNLFVLLNTKLTDDIANPWLKIYPYSIVRKHWDGIGAWVNE
jgi:hypothetical protein